jgi:hypothetical protein
MIMLLTLLPIFHFIGLALGVGAATVKVWLVLKCRSDNTFISVHARVAPILTRQIVVGIILLALSGIAWLAAGYSITPLLIVKIILAASILAIGPIIDNVIEPKYYRLAPTAGEAATADFIRVQNHYLVLEIFATLLFYVVIVMWMLR